MWGLAIVSVISGMLFNVNPNYPYIFSIVFLLVAFCIVLLFKEVKVCDKRKIVEEVSDYEQKNRNSKFIL